MEKLRKVEGGVITNSTRPQPGELIDLAMVESWHGPHGLSALAGATGIGLLDAGRGQRGDALPVVEIPRQT